MYDGVAEYLVVVKESGQRQEEESVEEIRKRREKIQDWFSQCSFLTLAVAGASGWAIRGRGLVSTLGSYEG